LGDFIVREQIGHGAFGSVHRAEQPALGREAVIKVLQVRHQSSASATQRFLREARLASRLEHPFAAHIYAFGAEADGLLWIAMELVRGTSLDKLLATGAMAVDRFVPLYDRICEVVQAAHAQGIVHRDLKPANVMVTSFSGRLIPKLLDFGIAKGIGDEAPTAAGPVKRQEVMLEAAADTLDAPDASSATAATGGFQTQIGTTLGSPAYMAPEQWIDAAHVGPKGDLYALGILAYEALSGSPPFHGQTMIAFARAHATKEVPPLGGKAPPALDAVLQRALAKRPEERFDSALDQAAALRDAAGLGEQTESLPRLDERVRDPWLAEAPQPLADALALLDSARSAHQASSALVDVVGTVARWLGICALAARSHAGGRLEARGEGSALLHKLR
jgi:serine/threonine-protein kinase